jgi:hypothetical protein
VKEEVASTSRTTMARTKTKKSAASTPTPAPAPAHAAEAFALLRDEILAIPEAELLPLNLDVQRAAGRGALAAERIAPLMPELRQLLGLDVPRVERLGLYALALHHAHDLATEAGAGQLTLQRLLEEAVPVREDMLRSAELLAHFGVFSAERVAAIRSGQGYADTADDVIALGRLFLEEWALASGRVPVTRAMVDRAPVLGTEIHKALAQREVESSPLLPSDDRRFVQAQAFTLFARVYDEARRGVTFLRWRQRDVQRFVPTLYPQRPRGGPVEEVEEVEEVEDEREIETDLPSATREEVEAEAPRAAIVGGATIAANA